MPTIRMQGSMPKRDPWPSEGTRARQQVEVVPLQPTRDAWVVDVDGEVHKADAVAIASVFNVLEWPGAVTHVDEGLPATAPRDTPHDNARRSYTARLFGRDFAAESPFDEDAEVHFLLISPDPAEGVTGWWPAEPVFFNDRLAFAEADRIKWEAEEAERAEAEAREAAEAKERRRAENWEKMKAQVGI